MLVFELFKRVERFVQAPEVTQAYRRDREDVPVVGQAQSQGFHAMQSLCVIAAGLQLSQLADFFFDR
jgi:hypothetical protein